MRILMWEHFAPGGPIRVGGHHFAERFLRDGHRVAWCAGPLSLVNVLKRNAETRARLRLWRRGGESCDPRGLFAYAPMTLVPHRRYPILDSVAVSRMTLRATVPALPDVLDEAGFDAFDFLFMEPGAPLLALLDLYPAAFPIYRMCDATAEFTDTPRSFAAIEAETCRRAGLVLATARSLVTRAKSLGARRILYLPNACEPEPFEAPRAGLGSPPAGLGVPPAGSAGVPRPCAIYAGALESWFDAALVRDTARLLPRWTFVLIGPTRARLAEIDGLANVRILGPRPYASLPALFAAADAGIVPFRLTPMTHAIHPIKIYEYLAAGLPVVSTPMEETAAMGAPLTLAAGAEEFARALEAARQSGPAARAERQAYARRNSWDARYAALRAELGLPEEEARLRAAGGLL
jgi:glycosyltransferase involved in cell wall biosynthesis